MIVFSRRRRISSLHVHQPVQVLRWQGVFEHGAGVALGRFFRGGSLCVHSARPPAFLLRGCTDVSGPHRAVVHDSPNSVIRTSGLWHDASAQDLVQCPLGCWIKQGSELSHVCPRRATGPVEIPGLVGTYRCMDDAMRALANCSSSRKLFSR